MGRKETDIQTIDLWKKLFKSPPLSVWMSETQVGGTLPSFSDYITSLTKEKAEKQSKVIERGMLGKSMGYYLFQGERLPSRDAALQIAFGLQLTPEETQELLKIARKSPLHPKVMRDAIIVHCLYNKIGIVELNVYLFENDLPLLGNTADCEPHAHTTQTVIF